MKGKLFDLTNTDQYDLLILADDYDDLCDNFRFEKKVISERYELKIDFQTPRGQLRNNEIEILSLLQTRYFMQMQNQDNAQNSLKINLSKSEYDYINFNVNSNLNSIKDNHPWLINTIRDGFQIFEINIDEDLVSITKGSDNFLSVSKRFYKSYRQRDGQNESFICVIGDSAFSPFNCKSWQNSQKQLQEAYKTWILEGEPLQLLDGLSLRSLPANFLSNVLSNLMTNVERRLIVISVIGLESSGKSTLLNHLFHCGFATSASRCTKGAYMSYRTTNFD
ncbi:hypothetical protein RclHR1_08460003 [Rhizophagus clarus]|uniref:Uncharacterized protein n=1 Tax=Rhizophagus clarus TaxID=94130 RepID=A0A2Z6S105_9GLOM|nr:hypothetical protein RclHR1_08460003 [Rhizophagus clarus]